MVWKVEAFKYVKMGRKGVPFGYLEFSCTFRGKPCPYARASPLPESEPGHGRVGPGPVLFGQGHMGADGSLEPDPVSFWTGPHRCRWVAGLGGESTLYPKVKI